MDRQPVTSTNLVSVGYDSESATLEVEFASGTVYQYFDVPEAVFQGILEAPSAGQFHAENIKGVYRYARV